MWHGSSPVPTEKTHGATERLNHPHPTFDLFVMVRLQPRFKRHRAVNPLKCLPNLPGRGGGEGGEEGVGSLKESLGGRVAFITPFISLPGIRQASARAQPCFSSFFSAHSLSGTYPFFKHSSRLANRQATSVKVFTIWPCIL